MSATIDQAYINQYSDNVYHLLAQRGSKLMKTLPMETANGEKHFFERLGQFTASERVSRFQPTVLQDGAHSRRMATVAFLDAFVGIDKIDTYKMLIDPTSSYVKEMSDAFGRKVDDKIITAMLGTAATGKDGTGSQAFDTSNQQIAHGSAGFTVAKFNQALRILETNEVDLDAATLYLALGARGVEDLLGENNYVSFDFQEKKALASNSLPEFRGVQIVRTQRVTDETAGTTFRGLLYTNDNTKCAMSSGLSIQEDNRPDLSNTRQLGANMTFGAVRMDENTIVDVLYQ